MNLEATVDLERVLTRDRVESSRAEAVGDQAEDRPDSIAPSHAVARLGADGGATDTAFVPENAGNVGADGERALLTVDDQAQARAGQRVADVLVLGRGVTERTRDEAGQAEHEWIAHFTVESELGFELRVADAQRADARLGVGARVRIDALALHPRHRHLERELQARNRRERTGEVARDLVFDHARGARTARDGGATVEPRVLVRLGHRAALHLEGAVAVVGDHADAPHHLAVGACAARGEEVVRARRRVEALNREVAGNGGLRVRFGRRAQHGQSQRRCRTEQPIARCVESGSAMRVRRDRCRGERAKITKQLCLPPDHRRAREAILGRISARLPQLPPLPQRSCTPLRKQLLAVRCERPRTFQHGRA